MKIEAIRKTQTEGFLEMENLEMKTGTTRARFTKRIKDMKERITNIEDAITEMDISVKEKFKSKKFLT